MIPRATPSGSSHTPSCGSRQSIAHHTHPEKCAPYIHFSRTNTNGFIQGNMLNTPQAVPLICKASVVQLGANAELQKKYYNYTMLSTDH